MCSCAASFGSASAMGASSARCCECGDRESTEPEEVEAKQWGEEPIPAQARSLLDRLQGRWFRKEDGQPVGDISGPALKVLAFWSKSSATTLECTRVWVTRWPIVVTCGKWMAKVLWQDSTSCGMLGGSSETTCRPSRKTSQVLWSSTWTANCTSEGPTLDRRHSSVGVMAISGSSGSAQFVARILTRALIGKGSIGRL